MDEAEGAPRARRPRRDPLDRVEAVAERAADRVVERFAERTHIQSYAVARFVFPLVMLAVGAIALTLLYLDDLFAVWSFTAVAFLPLGIDTGPPYGVLVQGLHPALVITIILYGDAFGGLFLVWNLEYLFRVPRLGPWLRKVETKAEGVWQRHRFMRDLGVTGLGVFVAIPLSGTGAIPGTILGRLAGFPWALVWISVFLGSAVRVILYTLALAGVMDLFGWGD